MWGAGHVPGSRSDRTGNSDAPRSPQSAHMLFPTTLSSSLSALTTLSFSLPWSLWSGILSFPATMLSRIFIAFGSCDTKPSAQLQTRTLFRPSSNTPPFEIRGSMTHFNTTMGIASRIRPPVRSTCVDYTYDSYQGIVCIYSRRV